MLKWPVIKRKRGRMRLKKGMAVETIHGSGQIVGTEKYNKLIIYIVKITEYNSDKVKEFFSEYKDDELCFNKKDILRVIDRDGKRRRELTNE